MALECRCCQYARKETFALIWNVPICKYTDLAWAMSEIMRKCDFHTSRYMKAYRIFNKCRSMARNHRANKYPSHTF